MIHRIMKLVISVILLICIVGSLSAAHAQVRRTVDKWVSESILSISHKVQELSEEYDDPFFVPKVLIGPMLTRTPRRPEFYESQLDLLLRDSIYLKIAAGLAPIDMKLVDADTLPRAIAASKLDSATRLNAMDIVSSYARDETMRQCVKRLLNVADMVVLGQTVLKNSRASTTFRILRREGEQVYLGRSPIHFELLPDAPDVSVDVAEDKLRRMIEFSLSTDAEMRKSIDRFVRRFIESWSDGDFDRIMSYYDEKATAVTMTVGQDSTVSLTNVLDRSAIRYFWTTSRERYRSVNFDLRKPRVFDAKWNSRNVASFGIAFFADVTVANGKVRRLPLLSLYVQIRRGAGKSWKVYFQRIKELPRYSMKTLERW